MCNGHKSVFSVIYNLKMENILCFILIFLSLRHNICLVKSFNLDTLNYVSYFGPPGSMFGFSVAEHKENGQNWVLVGAPEADSRRQPGVYKGGAVFRCYTDSDRCDELLFDRTGNNNFSDGHQMDEKSNQWFGATVRSSGENGSVVACAPRYVYFSSYKNKREPVGTCFVASRGFSEFAEYSPCRTRHWGYHRQGSCQAGLGADFSRKGERLFIGAVGSWYWQGQLHSIDSNARLPFPVPPKISYFQEGQVYSQSSYSRPDVFSTAEGPPADDDSYLGYSVTTGNFGGGFGSTDVAAGMPRGAGLVGKVVLYTWNMTNLQNITGVQLGAYFGYSLCALDIDGDGLDDLVVGAPLYTDFNDNDGSYENGRVYIIYQGRDLRYRFKEKLHEITGKNSKGRFGLAVASLGDINKDGYGDVAVGAPYDNGVGAVYIFHGSPEGIHTEPSQVITPEKISSLISTFGFSLSGGHDLDDNQYPDLVVGAYDSDTSVFLRARPVVKVQSFINFGIDSKQIILEERNCSLRDGTKVPCLPLTACVKYSGIGVNNSLDMDINLLLDSKKTKNPRMFFLNQEGRHNITFTKQLTKGRELCESMAVYVKSGIRDKLTVLEAEMKYILRGERQWEETSKYNKGRYARSYLFPIINRNEPLFKKDAISIQKNCGKDNICIPDLRLTAKPSVSKYLLGSGERLWIEVYIQNAGEDSFESIFDMSVPKGLDYVKIERLDSDREIPVQCSAPSFINNYTLHCDIGNPLPREKFVSFKVIFQPFHKEGLDPRYEFSLAVNSTNPENKDSLYNNFQKFNVTIWVNTDVLLSGSSQPAEIHYDSSLYESTDITQESQIGPQVVHTYSIRNKGPSDIKQAEVTFNWPSYTVGGDPLLYLLEPPEKSGPVECEPISNINPLKLKLDKRKKSYLQMSSSTGGLQGGLISGQPDVRQNQVSPYEQGVNESELWGRAEGSAGTVHTEDGSYSSSSYSHREGLHSASQQYNQGEVHHRPGNEGEEDVSTKFKFYERFKRETDDEEKPSVPDSFKCGPAQCTRIKCTVGPLTRDQEAFVAFRARVWVRTFKKFAYNPAVNLSSEVVGRVVAIPHFGKPDFVEDHSEEVSTVMRPKAVGEKTEVVPLWVVVLSACAGAIILMLLVYLLYKCGFFKRNRPSDAPEKEPLNRNGHYQSGDEQL